MVIVFVAAAALGRIASVPAGIRVAEPVSEPTVPAGTVPIRGFSEVGNVKAEDTQTVV